MDEPGALKVASEEDNDDAEEKEE
jgi:hypothetical protein